MEENESGWESDWAIRLRIWIERDGQTLLGPERLELLEAIDRCRSISGAARQVGVSYRHAWLLVQSVNEAAGRPLVESAVGGTKGGGARLTELGQRAIQAFGQLQKQVQAAAAKIAPRVLPVDGQRPLVHVAAAISLEEVLGQLLADYALMQPAVGVRAIFGASNELAEHLLAGAPCDLFLSADSAQVERLQRAGLSGAAAPTAIARNGLAVVTPADSPSDIRRMRDLLRGDVQRVAIADPESPLGSYTRDYLRRLSLYDRLRDRAVIADSSRGVLAAVRAGRAAAGIVYGSDAATAAELRTAFRPRTEAVVAEYRAAVLATARSPDEAQTLLEFMTSPAALRKFHSRGFLSADDRT